MMSTNYLKWTVLLFILLWVGSCGGSGSDSDASSPVPQSALAPAFAYSQPAERGDGWRTASAVDLGMDVTGMETLMAQIQNNAFGFRRMDGVLVVKNGDVVFEAQLRNALDMTDQWAENQDPELHAVHSVTKSIMSAAVGIAIEQGLIAGVEESALSYFTALAPFGQDEEAKLRMTLHDWLTMQHGLQWNEWDVNYLDERNQNLQMIESPDPLGFLFNLPMAGEPGESFAYSTGISYALGEVIARASGQRFYDFVIQNLFVPLQIDEYDTWWMQGDAHAGSSLYLSQRSMAKIGQMFLDGGVWAGQQVVPAHWVTLSTTEHVSQGSIRYGYQWWLRNYRVGGEVIDTVYASGWGGQLIFILPALDAVVVMTGSRYEDGDADQTSVTTMMQEYILPFVMQ